MSSMNVKRNEYIGRFSVISVKNGNVCDFLFTLLSGNGSTPEGKNLLSLRANYFLNE